MKEEHKLYCSKCGALCQYSIKKTWYSGKTGNTIFGLDLVCPNRPRFFDWGHYKYWPFWDYSSRFAACVNRNKLADYGLISNVVSVQRHVAKPKKPPDSQSQTG